MPAFLAGPALKIGIVAIVIAGIAIWIGVLKHERDSARAKVTTLQAQVEAITAANHLFQSQVTEQNAAIDQLRKDGDAARARLAAADAQVRALSAHTAE